MYRIVKKRFAWPVIVAAFLACGCSLQNRGEDASATDYNYFEKLIRVGVIPLKDGSELTGYELNSNPDHYLVGIRKGHQWVQCGARGVGGGKYELTGDSEIQDQGTVNYPPFKYENINGDELLLVGRPNGDPPVAVQFKREFSTVQVGEIGRSLEMSRIITDKTCRYMAKVLVIK